MDCKNMYCVTNMSGRVNEYFDSRDAAVAFIVDEFAMTLIFRNDNEGRLLTDYMSNHDETPNQYPFHYKIEEIKVNHDYDKPKSYELYLVTIEKHEDDMDDVMTLPFSDYDEAKKCFNDAVSKDESKIDSKNTCRYGRGETMYERYNSSNGIHDHFFASITKYLTDGKSYEKEELDV